MTTETTAPAGTREQALAAIDTAEKALYGTSSRGSWEHSTRLRGGRRGLVTHVQTGDILGEFDYAADAGHAAQWQPRRIQALIARDRAILDRHKSDPQLDDGACSCGWEECPEVAAVVEFWTASDRPEIVPLFDATNVYEVLAETLNQYGENSPGALDDATSRLMALITGKTAS